MSRVAITDYWRPPSLSILRWGVTPTWHDDGYRPGVDCPQGSPPWCLCWGCDPESWAGAEEAQRASAARHSEVFEDSSGPDPASLASDAAEREAVEHREDTT